ncbi:MAG: hypothetical protein J6A01_12755 [Proteobacteria bacterium]|nr:hypothetical protein [Pseudomonadota bacterium]
MSQPYFIEKQHFCGDGIAVCDGRSIRIANALKGETVLAEDVSVRRRRQAFLDEVTERSADRCAPICEHWKCCPACQYQCLRIEQQREIKKNQWLTLIKKFVDIPEDCEIGFYEAPQTLGYRCRIDALVCHGADGAYLGILPRLDAAAFSFIQMGMSLSDLGMLEPGDVLANENIEHVPLAHCPLHSDELNALIDRLEPLMGSFLPQTRVSLEAYGDSARVVIFAMPEHAKATHHVAEQLAKNLDISVVFQELPPRGSHVYPQPVLLGGSPWHCYAHNELGQALYVRTGAWTPVNPVNAQLIRQSMMRMVEGRHFEHVLELGCGCGTHSTVFSGVSAHYTGIDAAWPAILSAQHNAENYRWGNVAFFTDSADHYLDKRYYKGVRVDAIVMHSNRMPYSEKTAHLCLRFGAKDLFIAAPTAFAMAQECRHFFGLGFHLKKLSLCDTLPLTYHMMATAHLSRLR